MPTAQEHAASRKRSAATRGKARKRATAGGSTDAARGKRKAFKAKISKDSTISANERRNMMKSFNTRSRKKQAKKANYQHEG